MFKTKSLYIPVLLIAAVFSLSANAASEILPAPQKLTDHVYAWIGPLDGPSKKNQGYRMNLAFVVGNNAVAVLETGYTEAMGEAMLAHIHAITDKPVKYAVNTNSQPDRFMGNSAFRRAGATIIAHKDSAKRMAAQGANYAGNIERILELPAGSVKIPKAPDRIIDSETELDLGGVTVVLDNFGPAHTPAQLVAAISADKVVYTGDMLYAQRLLAINTEGNIKSWLAAFDRLKQFGDVIFIPGHGQPGPLKDFDFPTRQYLELLYTHMQKKVDEGVDLQDAIDSLDQSRFSKLDNFKDLAGRNASRAYLEQEAAAFE
jgi:glyoxylase-like metal-dependent hydrolase (beta-lactamase superfamily II)